MVVSEGTYLSGRTWYEGVAPPRCARNVRLDQDYRAEAGGYDRRRSGGGPGSGPVFGAQGGSTAVPESGASAADLDTQKGAKRRSGYQIPLLISSSYEVQS